MAMNPNFGYAPAGADRQLTWSLGFDALLFNPADALAASYELFDSSTTKATQYRSGILQQLAQQKDITISAIRVDHNLAFAAEESEAVGSQLQSFNLFSYLRISVFQKSEDRISVADLVPYELINVQGTVTSALKQNPLFVFPEPILVPAGGDISITLLPLTGKTLAASAATNPHLPGVSGATSNRQYHFTVRYYGSQARPVA